MTVKARESFATLLGQRKTPLLQHHFVLPLFQIEKNFPLTSIKRLRRRLTVSLGSLLNHCRQAVEPAVALCGLVLINALAPGDPLGRIVGYARKCQLVSTPEIPASRRSQA